MSTARRPSFWQQQLVDEAVLAYVAWREESAAVWAAYGHWSSAAADEAIVHTRHIGRRSTAKRPPRTSTRSWSSGSASGWRQEVDHTLTTRDSA